MLYEFVQLLQENKKIRFGILFGGLGAVCLLVIWWVVQPNYLQYTALKTPFNARTNFAELKGNDILAYDGLAFYKTDSQLKQNPTVLNRPGKLPTVNQLVWADQKGALLNFSGSFSLSRVEQILLSQGLELTDNSQSYTWYLDFSHNSLHVVTNMPLLPRMAVYSPAEQGFYYIPNTATLDSIEYEANAAGEPLYFYNTSTKQNSVVSNDLGVLDVTYLGSCPDANQKVCFIGRDVSDLKKVKLYALTRANQKQQLLESDGRLFATNKSELFLSAPATSEKSIPGDEAVDYSPVTGRFYNIKTNQQTSAGFKIGGEEVLTYVGDGKFYTIGASSSANQTNTTYYSGVLGGDFKAKAKPFKLAYQNGEPFADSFSALASFGNNGQALLSTIRDNQVLITPTKNAGALPSQSTETTKNVVNTCVKSTAKDSQYFEDSVLFKVFFFDDSDFAQNIQNFTDCVLKTDSRVLLSANFYFGTISPIDGRITSD